MFKKKNTKNRKRRGEEEKKVVTESSIRKSYWNLQTLDSETFEIIEIMEELLTNRWDLKFLKKNRKEILIKLGEDKEFGKQLIIGVAQRFIHQLEKGKGDDKIFTFVAKLIKKSC